MTSERSINEIRNEKGVITTDPGKIIDTFVSFYNSLYQSETPTNPANRNNFLDGLDFPSITEEARYELDKELEPEEVSNAILLI